MRVLLVSRVLNKSIVSVRSSWRVLVYRILRGSIVLVTRVLGVLVYIYI